MPQKPEALTFVSDPVRTLEELRIACQQAHLSAEGTLDMLRARLLDYLTDFTEQEDIVCLNPEKPAAESGAHG
jgi:hypothetical protein